jgi:hypothetical protein
VGGRFTVGGGFFRTRLGILLVILPLLGLGESVPVSRIGVTVKLEAPLRAFAAASVKRFGVTITGEELILGTAVLDKFLRSLAFELEHLACTFFGVGILIGTEEGRAREESVAPESVEEFGGLEIAF